jgi:putative ABC transport system permease protein
MLATVGLYAAVFYSVSERKKELGIRAALGASPQVLRNMILRQTSVVTIAGVCIGMLCGVIATGLAISEPKESRVVREGEACEHSQNSGNGL